MSPNIILDRVKAHIEAQLCLKAGDRILISVSGGLDSMVLLDVLLRLKQDIGVAHINHSTRNGASDLDQQFVKEYCQERGIPFHTTTLDYDDLSKGNFQNNARNARYKFLEDIKSRYDYKYIATAHHLDDVWETLVINLARGSGSRGLSSISFQNESIIRPLLDSSRAELEAYQSLHDIPYREDESNASNDYTRNRIRNTISPIIKQAFPNLLQGVLQSTTLLSEQDKTFRYLVNKMKQDISTADGQYMYLDMTPILLSPHPQQLLYGIVEEYGFTYSDTQDMLAASTGSIFLSTSYEALIDRKRLIIRPRGYQQPSIHMEISDVGVYTYGTVELVVSKQDNGEFLLPISLLSKTMLIRTWEAGDHFHPHGMGGKRKKIKDYLNDIKMDTFAKETALVAIVDNNIVQVIGHRNAHNLPQDKEYFTIKQRVDKTVNPNLLS